MRKPAFSSDHLIRSECSLKVQVSVINPCPLNQFLSGKMWQWMLLCKISPHLERDRNEEDQDNHRLKSFQDVKVYHRRELYSANVSDTSKPGRLLHSGTLTQLNTEWQWSKITKRYKIGLWLSNVRQPVIVSCLIAWQGEFRGADGNMSSIWVRTRCTEHSLKNLNNAEHQVLKYSLVDFF